MIFFHIWSYAIHSLFIFYIYVNWFHQFWWYLHISTINYLHHHRQSQDFPQFSTAWEVTKMHPMRPIRPLAVGRGHAVLDFLDLSRTESASAACVIPCVEQNHNRSIAAIATSFHLIWLIFLRIAIDIYRCYRVWSCIDLYTSPYFAHFKSFQRLDSWWFIQIPRCFRANSPRLKDTQGISRHCWKFWSIVSFVFICIHLSCPDSFWPRSKTRHDSKPHSQTFANRRCKKCASAKFWVQGSVPCLCSLLRLVHFDLFQSRHWKYCFADSTQPKH